MGEPYGFWNPPEGPDDYPGDEAIDARYDEEFGITLDPCEHPSINGTTCGACGAEVEL